jgi:hypothetical protein
VDEDARADLDLGDTPAPAARRVTLSRLGRAAVVYATEIGLPIFPCEPRGKKPLTRSGFHDATQHIEQVCEWWETNPDANIGFSPGSMGWLVFDLDTAEAIKVAEKLGLLAAPTLECVTARGRHLYFRLPKGVTVGNASRWGNNGIDIRSSAGYVLLPPSVHESGHVYKWLGYLA